jgi:hypothetical protein
MSEAGAYEVSKSTYDNWKCDRCGAEGGPIDAVRPSPIDAWGLLTCTAINGPRSSNGLRFAVICPTCLQLLHEWLTNGTSVSP